MMSKNYYILTIFLLFLCQVSCDEVVVGKLSDSLNGICGIDSSSCNLRACVSYMQGKVGKCKLISGVHIITYGGLGTSSVGLQQNTVLTIEGNTANDTFVDGGNQLVAVGISRRFMIINEATSTLRLQRLTFKNFNIGENNFAVDEGCFTTHGAILRILKGSLHVNNCRFVENTAGTCSAIFYSSNHAPGTRAQVENSQFINNHAVATTRCNSAPNNHGTLCNHWDVRDSTDNAAPYLYRNLLFTGNTGAVGGEGVAIHVGNYMGGNAYAADGMMWYGNGYYASFPCLSYVCTLAAYKFQYLNESETSAVSSSVVPSFMPTAVFTTIASTSTPTVSSIGISLQSPSPMPNSSEGSVNKFIRTIDNLAVMVVIVLLILIVCLLSFIVYRLCVNDCRSKSRVHALDSRNLVLNNRNDGGNNDFKDGPFVGVF